MRFSPVLDGKNQRENQPRIVAVSRLWNGARLQASILVRSRPRPHLISFSDCITQFYLFCVFEGLECLLLTVMCYDRYVAICKPLHYNVTMNFQFCCIMVITCWVLIALLALIPTITIPQLKFCGSNTVNHFFCDLDPILQLSCSDTTIIILEVTLLNFVFVFIPFCTIIVSYVYIIITIFKIPSISSRQRVFSTCSSHLIVVSIFYGTMVCVYLLPQSGPPRNTKILALMYTVVTPLLNPIIYSLRNKDFKIAVDKMINHCLHWLFSK
ncbi:olfactory receptor 10A7-like [Rana temporaria]|uniref:olfactory receptor 10A7-like n=1 Tax=Rana temporaria TaxID=8407 RepID=UPI001AACE437|nr:olfactory receptor 10A7-like [Rana temporaria]